MNGRVTRARKMTSTWLLFWEGALITHFFGLKVAALWCGAFYLIALGVRLGIATARSRH